jgi:hypothetical protein
MPGKSIEHKGIEISPSLAACWKPISKKIEKHRLPCPYLAREKESFGRISLESCVVASHEPSQSEAIAPLCQTRKQRVAPDRVTLYGKLPRVVSVDDVMSPGDMPKLCAIFRFRSVVLQPEV